MMQIEEPEKVVDSLPENEYRRFRNWFLEKNWAKWDREIEKDTRTGALVFLLDEARE